MSPLTATYRTKDDRHVQLMFLQGDRYWPDFCRTVDRPDLADDDRFADIAARRTNAKECVAELDAIFALHTLDEWKGILAKLDAPWAPIQSVEELVDDPQVLANSYIGDVETGDGVSYRLPTVPVQFDGQPPELRRAPEHGEHTEAILAELGYDWDRIGELAEGGVIP
jgi:crotonobetainyl-CoA:carnitine CoA-transferase CaiB-like acyl-CoA transferase